MTEKVKPRRTSAKRTKKDTWTIAELQMWMTSVFDVQGDDWYPNEEQWAKIVDMIFKLKEPERVKTVDKAQRPPLTAAQGAYHPAQPMQMQPQFHPQDFQMPQDFGLGANGLIPPPNDVLPPNAENLEALRRDSEFGTGMSSTGPTIKSATLGQFNQ